MAADDDGFARGRTAFETLRVYGRRPFRLAEHLARLDVSVERLGLPPVDRTELVSLVESALAAADLEDAVLRIYRTPGAPGETPVSIVLVAPVPEWVEEVRARGSRLVSLPFPRRSLPWLLPGTKSVSYAAHVAAEAEAERRGADGAVLCDLDGTVLEGTVTNVWWREGRTLVTPSLELGILAGETRAALLELAPSCGYDVETGAFPLERMRRADEIFTSSSVREVLPVVALDGSPLQAGEAAADLQRALRRAASGEPGRP